ncbi:MAG TPA: anti-sigma factor [Paracoccaceae bacterium]|nr:anti-sigma factor [Paracoccaceae bacterium]
MTAEPRSSAELADEYVLGLLEAGEQAELEARLASDPELAAAVARAQDRFLDLALTAPDLGEPPGLWQRIGAAIGDPAPEAEVVELRPRARRPVAEAPRTAPGRGWRWTAIASLAAALLLAAGLVWQVMQARPPQMIAVILDDATGAPVLMVEAREGEAARLTLLSDVPLPAGKTLELWTVPPGGTSPVSLGVLAEGRSGSLAVSETPVPAPEQLFAVSIEDEGGSPTGSPTGRVLGHGRATAPR